MFAIAWSQGTYKASWANWRVSLIVGACLLLGGNGGVTIAEKYIDSGLAALIVAIVPIYIVILGWATGTAPRPAPIVWLGLVGGFAGEKLSMRVLIAAALIIGSVAIVITTQQLRARAEPAIGSAIEPAD